MEILSHTLMAKRKMGGRWGRNDMIHESEFFLLFFFGINRIFIAFQLFSALLATFLYIFLLPFSSLTAGRRKKRKIFHESLLEVVKSLKISEIFKIIHFHKGKFIIISALTLYSSLFSYLCVL